MADITITNCGSVFQFHLNTEAAESWVEDNVQSEGWQWLGRSLCVDHHYAAALAQALLAAGLEVA